MDHWRYQWHQDSDNSTPVGQLLGVTRIWTYSVPLLMPGQHCSLADTPCTPPQPDRGATPHCDCSYHLSYNEGKPILIPLSSHAAVTKGQLQVGPDNACVNAQSPSLGPGPGVFLL